MVVTRSQGETAEREEQRLEQERLERGHLEQERRRRFSMEPPASPSVPIGESSGAAAAAVTARPKSPALSQRTNNSTLRLRLAELEAAEKLAEIRRKELQIETDLVKKRLATQVAAIEDEESVRGEPITTTDELNRVNDWLKNTSLTRGERDETPRHTAREERPQRTVQYNRGRSPTPGRARNSVGIQLAEALEKMARPQRRYNCDLPAFSGFPNEWLPFKAAFRDSTQFYKIPAAENLLRLRGCLKGEARDAVAVLLYSATDPNTIMRTLEQCFGRPEIIVDKLLEDLKKQPKPGPTASELNQFAVKVQNVVCTLQSLDRRGYLHTPQIAREVIEKLSPHIKSKWCEYAYENRDTTEPEIVTLSQFLMREADIALRYTYASTTSNATAAREYKSAPIVKKKNPVYTVEEPDVVHCPNCNNAHVLHRCPEYRAANIEKRWNIVREKGLCFKCIEHKHRRFQCKAKPCGVNQCRRPHHATLHDNQPEPQHPEQQRNEASNRSDAVVLSVATEPATEPSNVLLKVCPVVVSGPRGKAQTYALLDEGATITLIDEKLAKIIGADGPSEPLLMSGVNMSQRERDSKIVTLSIQGKNESARYKLKARTVRDLQLRRQKIPSSLLQHEHLRDLKERDVCYEQARPLVLVGANHWELIVSRELRIGATTEPAASRTQLGWVVHGTAPRSIIYGNDSVLHIYTPNRRLRTSEAHDQQLHDLVEAHFQLDSLGVSLKPRVSQEDERALRIFQETVRKIDGAYEVGLPWRSDDVTMPPSFKSALNRLKNLERKLDSDSELAADYTGQIENLIAKGYAVPCDGTEKQSAVSWFLPHFAVENPNKPGKRRIVFDAAHRSYGVSLNDRLVDGPDLLLSLQGIVFRFREKHIAVTADIQEMFLRIKIRPEDQPAQQFLWRGRDRTSPPRAFKMTSMIFGAASSPFLAHSVRNHNAHAHAKSHPRALAAITGSHYMDDLVDSYDNEDEARRTIHELREVHENAGFTLRSWNTNDPAVLRDIPRELHATEPTTLGGASPESKILGLCWNPKEDELGFNTAMSRVPSEVRLQSRAPTKREALSAVMSIYDPLGLISLYSIRAKIILQNLWRLQIPWDEPIPAEEAEQFATWIEQLTEISRLRLQRSYALQGYENIELHIMCDASEQAYATVAYWRATQDEEVNVVLVAAKAKVAPRRAQTIPRLELQAAVIGARLADTIKREHRVKVARTIYWTDSSTVVQWIKNDRRRYTPFVEHRLGEIAELTHRDEWRWLPTEYNVADDATRLTNTPITSNDRWFHGPSFLHQPEDHWPSRKIGFEDSEHEVLHITESDKTSSDWLPDPTRFSRYEVLVRTVARVLAFIDMCRRRATRLELEHVERAEQLLLQRAQQESFDDELRYVRASHPIPKTSRLYKLDPVVEDGLLRVRGRINASDAPIETKRPIILNGRHAVTRLLVHQAHCRAAHGNRERVTNDLRQRYWIIHLRPTVRATEHSCTFCRVRKATPNAPITGDLPKARLQSYQRAFSYCACDYFGPMWIKIGRRREKRWGALYTCLTTRAVHLEIVASLSSCSAIMALRRMAARRGWPRELWSDNATAFRGADQELKKAYEEWEPLLREEGLRNRMRCMFIAPGAPRHGGAWERLVRSVKTSLSITLKEKVPTEEVLQTVLAEAEYAINARPLTYVSVDARDPEALTPNHFLLGSSAGLPTTGPCSLADRRTWRTSQALADSFWRRWVREYLPTLVPRGGADRANRNIEQGDVVVVIDRTMPRNVWPMGIVVKTFPGPDGGVRVVDIKTKNGIFRRPAYKLAVLEKEKDGYASCAEGRMLRTTSPSAADDGGARRGARSGASSGTRRGSGRAGARRRRLSAAHRATSALSN